MAEANLGRKFHSEGYLSEKHAKEDIVPKRLAKSEPALWTSSPAHPLLDQSDDNKPHHYQDLILAAETLENIVNEGAFVGNIQSKFKWSSGEKQKSHIGREMSDIVLKLVYGTMKCNLWINNSFAIY